MKEHLSVELVVICIEFDCKYKFWLMHSVCHKLFLRVLLIVLAIMKTECHTIPYLSSLKRRHSCWMLSNTLKKSNRTTSVGFLCCNIWPNHRSRKKLRERGPTSQAYKQIGLDSKRQHAAKNPLPDAS